jgi:hypothetical protein
MNRRSPSRQRVLAVAFCLSSVELFFSEHASAQAINYELKMLGTFVIDSGTNITQILYSIVIYDHIKNEATTCTADIIKSTWAVSYDCAVVVTGVPAVTAGDSVQTLIPGIPFSDTATSYYSTFWQIDHTTGVTNFCTNSPTSPSTEVNCVVVFNPPASITR